MHTLIYSKHNKKSLQFNINEDESLIYKKKAKKNRHVLKHIEEGYP